MANNKTGFDYYNLNTDRYLDIRIKRLKKDFGCAGISVYDYILCEVYRVKGCFSEWDESRAFDVAEYFNLKESLVCEIVKYCGSVGLFNKELLSGGIITSKSIQNRYVEMCKRAKRASIKIPSKIIIHEESDIITEESDIIQEETPQNSYGLRQSKVKERKVNENKEIISLSEFKIQQQNKFDNLDKACLTYLNALGITKPLIYLTKFVNDPPMDFVEIVLDCYRDEEWRIRMKNLYGDGLNDAYSRFVKEKSISEYVKSAYRNKEEFQTHFQNYYNKQKR